MKVHLKLLSLLAVSTGLLLTKSWLVVGLTTIVVSTTLITSGGLKRLLAWFKPLIVVILAIILLQSFTFSAVGFSLKGLVVGLFFSLRLLALLMLVFWLVVTTSLSDLAKALNWLPLDLGQVLLITLALLPQTIVLTQEISRAQLARGVNFKSVKLLTIYAAILGPLLNKVLTKSQSMTLAMRARGFGD